MLRYVIGGVALLATGYGVKKFVQNLKQEHAEKNTTDSKRYNKTTNRIYVELDETKQAKPNELTLKDQTLPLV